MTDTNPSVPTSDTDKKARFWGLLCHLTALSGLIVPPGIILGPLVVWLIKKDEYAIVDEQGKEALNFQLSMLIYSVVAALLIIVIVGAVLLVALFIANIVFVIIASIKFSNNVPFRYPLTIRFLK